MNLNERRVSLSAALIALLSAAGCASGYSGPVKLLLLASLFLAPPFTFRTAFFLFDRYDRTIKMEASADVSTSADAILVTNAG